MTLAQHSSASNEHGTPAYIVEAARRVLGAIDLDPASCAAGNAVVQATRYLTADHGARSLNGTWCSGQGKPLRVFLNPPGGKKSADNAGTAAWWDKLVEEWQAGRVHSAIFICFSMAIFRTGQSASLPPHAFPFCVPEKRINYDKLLADGTRLKTRGAPADSAIIYLPTIEEFDAITTYRYAPEGVGRFVAEFSPIGYVRT